MTTDDPSAHYQHAANLRLRSPGPGLDGRCDSSDNGNRTSAAPQSLGGQGSSSRIQPFRPTSTKGNRRHARSALTNGARPFLKPVSGNSEEARRFADLLHEVEAEHGGRDRMSVALHAAARAFAGLCVQRELMEVQLAQGTAIDDERYGQLCDRIDRQARRLVPPKGTKPKADLRGYLATRKPS